MISVSQNRNYTCCNFGLMKMNTLRTLAIAVMPFLVACEGNTYREWNVVNNSSTQIQIELISGNSGLDYSTVGPDSVRKIIITDQLGGSEFAGNPVHSFDSLLIYNLTDTLVKSVYDSSNWIVESEHVSKTPSSWEHKFTFTLTDQDF